MDASIPAATGPADSAGPTPDLPNAPDRAAGGAHVDSAPAPTAGRPSAAPSAGSPSDRQCAPSRLDPPTATPPPTFGHPPVDRGLSPFPAPLALWELLLLPASLAAILAAGRWALSPELVGRHPVLWMVRLILWLQVWTFVVAAADSRLGMQARFFPAFRHSVFAGTASVVFFFVGFALEIPWLFWMVAPLSAYAVQQTLWQSSDTGPEREHWARLPMILAIAHVFLLMVLGIAGLLILAS